MNTRGYKNIFLSIFDDKRVIVTYERSVILFEIFKILSRIIFHPIRMKVIGAHEI